TFREPSEVPPGFGVRRQSAAATALSHANPKRRRASLAAAVQEATVVHGPDVRPKFTEVLREPLPETRTAMSARTQVSERADKAVRAPFRRRFMVPMRDAGIAEPF